MDGRRFLVAACGVVAVAVVGTFVSECGARDSGTSSTDKTASTRQPDPSSDEQLCSGGDAKACDRAASVLLASKSSGAEQAASKFLEKACALKDLDRCFQLGNLQETGGSPVRSLEKALVTFDRACTDGHERACMHLGAIYIDGNGIPADPRKGMTFDERACARSETSPACRVLGVLLVTGQNGAPKDQQRGIAILEKSAKAGDAESEVLLAGMYASGNGVKVDQERSLFWSKLACAQGKADGCQLLGSVLVGRGGPGDNAASVAAMDALDKGCRLGATDACPLAAQLKAQHERASAIDANELWRAYDANELAADGQFKGKRFMLHGIVQSITKDFGDNAIVSLQSPNELLPTHLSLTTEQIPKAMKLHKGDEIFATCTCTGAIMGAPSLDGCEL